MSEELSATMMLRELERLNKQNEKRSTVDQGTNEQGVENNEAREVDSNGLLRDAVDDSVLVDVSSADVQWDRVPIAQHPLKCFLDQAHRVFPPRQKCQQTSSQRSCTAQRSVRPQVAPDEDGVPSVGKAAFRISSKLPGCGHVANTPKKRPPGAMQRSMTTDKYSYTWEIKSETIGLHQIADITDL